MGTSVSFDESACGVSIKVPCETVTVGATNHNWIDNGFLGPPIPGPFQNQKQGGSTFRVWDGLPPLRRGELPGLFPQVPGESS
jgi:hypothetical protein